MKRVVIFAVTLAFLSLSGTDSAAQDKKKKPKELEAEKLAKTLKSDKDGKARLAAAQELYKIAELKAAYVRPQTEILVDAFKGDSDAKVREAAGNVLLACEPDAKEVVPAAKKIAENLKEPNPVLTVAARLLGAYNTAEAKDAIPALQELKKREEAKEDQKLRDQNLLQAVNQALQSLSK